MIYMWFTDKLTVEKDRDSIFTTITTTWKPFRLYSHNIQALQHLQGV
jgi:ABC-type metal ion transport system substrate-binding protein